MDIDILDYTYEGDDAQKLQSSSYFGRLSESPDILLTLGDEIFHLEMY